MKITRMSLLLLYYAYSQAATVTSNCYERDPHNSSVEINVALEPQEYIYEDTIIITSHNPDISLSQKSSDIKAEVMYDQRYKKNVSAYAHPFTITCDATTKSSESKFPHDIQITFISNLSPEPQNTRVPVSFIEKSSQPETPQTALGTGTLSQTAETPVKKTNFFKEWGQKAQKVLSNTDSWAMRFIFAFLLGLLMSLTPCIYPMIPITVGILRSQNSTSFLHNFLLSFAYTLGLATTFSVLGFLAATSGSAFGHLMGNPLFVLVLIAFLCYFAFSLFGFYPLYIPRFMQQKQSLGKRGSFLSIFIFGLASGSVASPCLSPGLALILTMVATMANKMLGFLLLFLFGVGVSFPLLIIGTFSSSVNILPSAGMWMLQVQKVFGFMLLGMCLYYMSAILPTVVIQGLLTLLMIIIATYYYGNISSSDNSLSKTIKMLIAITAGAAGLFFGAQTIQEHYYTKTTQTLHHWYTDYDAALRDAQKEHKKVMLDFWAPYCSVCKLITKNVLQAPDINRVLEQKYIVVPINGNDASAEPYKTLKDRYGIQGFPDIIIIDPTTQEVIQRFKAELLEMDHTELIHLLQ